MRIVVTGYRGFIGSNLMMRLGQFGHETFGLDKNNCELSDFQAARDMIAEIRPDAIFHLAAQLPGLDAAPENFFKNNVYSTFNLLEGAKVLEKTPRIIFASTMNVYGRPSYLPVDERHPLGPVNIYGLTKLLAENLFRFYAQNFGYKVVVLRFSGVFGPGRDSGAITSFISRAMKGEDIEIDSDGSDTWDTVYINDAVRANMQALENIDRVGLGVFNIGSGRGLVVKEVAEEIIKLTGSSSRIKFIAGKERINFYYNIEKARRELGFVPASPEEGLRDFIAHRKSEMKVVCK